MKPYGLMGLVLCSSISTAASGTDNMTGRTIGAACLGCHGAAGSIETSIPPIIIGVPAEYIATSMKSFRDGSRKSTIMGRIARGYTDEEIDAVASYFAGLRGN